MLFGTLILRFTIELLNLKGVDSTKTSINDKIL